MDGSTLITHKECESDLIRALLFESSLVNGYSEQIHVDLFKEDVNRRIAKCVLSSKHEAESPADLYDLALRKLNALNISESDKGKASSTIMAAACEADRDSERYVFLDSAMMHRRIIILIERANKRSLRDTFSQALVSMDDCTANDIRVLVSAEVNKQELTARENYIVTMSDALQASQESRDAPGLYSNIRWWDEAISGDSGQGLAPGTKVAIAALPGVGKTALALQACLNYLLFNPGLHIVWGLTEMGKTAMIQRSLQYLSGLEMDKLRSSDDILSDQDRESKAYATEALKTIGQRVTFVETPVTSERLRKTVVSTGAGICVVDYLQRMMPDHSEDASNKTAHMDHCLSGLLHISQQYECSVIMISSTPKRIDPKTRIMDCFRDTGGAAFDADIIYFGEVDDETTTEKATGVKSISWYCEKHRQGIKHMSTYFDGSIMTYTNGAAYT